MNIAKQDFDDLLKQIRRIGDSIGNSRSRAISNKVPRPVAARHVDYLALRQQMGREPRQGDVSVIFAATRERTSASTSDLLLDKLPLNATVVAVFTGRGQAAQEIDVSGTAVAFAAGSGPQRFPLDASKVANNQVITRLEARRGRRGRYPVAVGPRLPAV